MASTNQDCNLTYVPNAVNFSTEVSRTTGIIHLFLCLFCILPYLVVLSAIVYNNSLNKFHAYRIMLHLSFMDMGELVSLYVVLALMMITNSPFNYLFLKVSFYQTMLVNFVSGFCSLPHSSSSRYLETWDQCHMLVRAGVIHEQGDTVPPPNSYRRKN